MNLSVGIVGLPNAGKSTLFNALLKKQVAFAANYPFATIEPNVGIVPVPDARLEKLAEIVENEITSPRGAGLAMTKKVPRVPATVKFVDIAGLVAGASKGEGLGNKFLAHIREVDLICQVTRSFTDPEVIHVAGEVNPQRDEKIIETELILADLQTLEKQPEPFGFAQGKPQGKTTLDDFKRWEVILKLKQELNNGKPAREVVTDPQEIELIRDLHLLTMKLVLQVVNVSENDLQNANAHNAPVPPLTLRGGQGELRENELGHQGIPESSSGQTLKQVQDDNMVVISAKIESELSSLSESEQKEYLESLGLQESGLERLIKKAYERLGLISFLTAGEKEVRAWTITRGTYAPKAAGVIHTDFEKGFIKAEVISFNDFVSLGGWAKAREQGKVRLEGKEYVMQDGDVVDFKVNA